ncbi:hypothetical protein BN7_2604 [Wickerhamomyces ciferrii]|uniref:GATA-type domain-containing protein n=1 Tax=Wickerhamomyces ciferrii (strain ATCC 14091 / BCRC 22168 / CBS 111 / JCM 3599 / NBRC 0793 / NRRL Y-1031 F-60-10) TaxID=1206466 RepID=K0KLG9_WICCF|nr:uncharacterized protein BN7_2604 [Wickerhamomyces ciferrii]CCH43057.1 hypothetical protein BN7_2604 [Wickerhamomyces ciferrii]
MIKLAAITSHNSDLASYASSYSMAEKNLSNQKTQLLAGASPSPSPHHQNSNDRASTNNSDTEDQTKPKKIRLPSISSIASSLQHPISHNEAPRPQLQTTPQQTSNVQQSPPSFTYNQRAHSDPELNKLRLAADIFTKEQQNQEQKKSNVSSPIVQHQQPTLYQIPPQPIPQYQQVPAYPQQFHQLPPPPQGPQPTGFPQHHQFPPQQQPITPSYYIAATHSVEPYPHYTTTPQHHLQHQIKPKRNYTRRLSKIQQENKLKPQLFCQRCGITETPEWRKGPNGARTLCNACGLFHAKILKRDGPEAAANAINSNKIIKKNHFKRRSSVNDTQLLHTYQHHQQAIPNQIPTHQPHPASIPFGHPQQVQLLPPPNQIFHQQPGPAPISQQLPPHPHQHQQLTPNQPPQRVISLPPGAQPIMNPQGIATGFISHPSSGAPTPVQQIPHHHPQQHLQPTSQQQQQQNGVILSPISPPVHEQNR